MAEEQQTPSSTDSRLALSPDSPAAHESPQPRNQKACDSCRSRKVKCRFSDGASECFVCSSLNIPCTFDRPRRKRGPPNKHAEAIRSAIASGSGAELRPQVLAERPRGSQGGWLVEFAPMTTIHSLLDEWFGQIHAVSPLLHRRRFTHRLRRGDADTDRFFCGLVVSVCAATVATLRRSSHQSITAQYCIEFVERHELLSRGLLAPDYRLDWCIAMYNLGVAHATAAGLDDASAYHMGCQSAAGVRHLAYYRLADLGPVEQQQLKRLFLLLLAWSCSADLFGRVSLPLFMCEEQLPHMNPESVSDEQLDPGEPGATTTTTTTPLCADMPPWHGDTTSYVPGLVALSELFLVWRDARRRCQPAPAAAVRQYLDAIQAVLDRLPAELRWRDWGPAARPVHVTHGHYVQVANIEVTSLHLRSNLLQMFGVADGDEHRRLVDDLLAILDHMPRAIFEANGGSIVPKIRDIGAAYLEQVHLGESQGSSSSGGSSSGSTTTATTATTTIAWPGDAAAKEKLRRLLFKLNDLNLWSALSPRASGARPGGFGSIE